MTSSVSATVCVQVFWQVSKFYFSQMAIFNIIFHFPEVCSIYKCEIVHLRIN